MPRSFARVFVVLCAAWGLSLAASAGAAERVPVLIGVRAVTTAPANVPSSASSAAARRSRLRSTATASEAAVLARLTAAQSDGSAGAVHAFWLAPIVVAEVTPQLRDELRRRADVRWVSDNAVVRAEATRTAGRPRTAAAPLWDPRAVAGVDEALRVYGLDGGGVRIAVLDTGVDISHPDLAGKMVTRDSQDPTYPGGWATIGANGVRDAQPLPPYDSDSHGTHVTGVALGGAASGVTLGAAPSASLMAALVLPGGQGRTAQIIGGMEWAADPDGDPLTDDAADIVNMSLGTADTVGALIEPLLALRDLGIVPVAATGNSPAALSAPATIPGCLGIGASDVTDAVAPYSARGTVRWNHAPYVGVFAKPDLVAPGTDIYSCVPDGEYAVTSGTSEASPFLAGVAALMRQANPALSPDSLRARLVRTAVDLAPAGADEASGAGRVDAYAAVTAAFAGRPWFAGTVRDAVSGAPLADAAITVTSGGVTMTLRSRADGGFAVRPVATTMTYSVAAFAHAPVNGALTLPVDLAQSLAFDLAPVATATVSGRVVDALSHSGVAATVQAWFGGLPAASVATDAAGAFALSLPVGADSVRVVPGAPYDTLLAALVVPPGGMSDVRLALSRPELLVVDACDFPDYFDLYAGALAAAGHTARVTRVRPDAATLRTYGKVLWFTGDATVNTFSDADQAAFESFVDGGGHALVMGKGVAREFVVSDFLPRVLRASAAPDITAPSSVKPAAGDPVFGGLTATIVPVPGGPAERPTALFAEDPSVASLLYGGSGSANNAIAAIAADLGAPGNGARLVYCGFGLEEMPSASDQRTLLDRALAWLEPAPVMSGTPLGDSDDDTAPLPVTVAVQAASTPLDTTTALLHYRVGAGSEIALPMLRAADGRFTAAIPPQPLGSTVKYRVSLADAAGRLAYWPYLFTGDGQPASYTVHIAADSLPPVLTHAPLYQTADLAGPYTIGFRAHDERGIAGAAVQWKWHSGDAWTQQDAASAGGDSFVVFVDGPRAPGDTLFYWLSATDASRRANVTYAPPAPAFALRIVRSLAWDFESDNGAFAVSGPDWQWGAPLAPAIGNYTVCPHSGTKVWATSLRYGYASYTSSSLTLPAVTIPSDAAAASLRFWHCYDFDGTPPSLLDGGTVQISTDDGAHYATLVPTLGYDGVVAQSTPGVGGQYGYGGTAAVWREAAFSLAAYAGQRVRIRFLEGAHLGGSGTGWFLDDMRIEWAPRDSTPPQLAVVAQPSPSPDTLATRFVDALAGDGETALASLALRYSTDGWRTTREVPCTPRGAPGGMRGLLPAQPRGSHVDWYLVASDAAGNQRRFPAGDSARSYSVYPSSPVMQWLPVAPGSVIAIKSRLCVPVGNLGCNLREIDPCQPVTGLPVLNPGGDIWDEARMGTLPGSLLAEYRVVILDAAWPGAPRARAVLDSLARADSLRAPGVLLVASSGGAAPPDSALDAWLFTHTGATRQAIADKQPLTWCTRDSLWTPARTGSLLTPATALRPGATTRRLLTACGADSAGFWAAGASDYPRTVAMTLSTSAFDSTTLAQLAPPLLRWLRGPARVVAESVTNTEDTQGPYRLRVLAWAPAGVDTTTMRLSVAAPPADPGVTFVTMTPGPGSDTYTATLRGRPVGTTLSLMLHAFDLTGAALPAMTARYSVIVDSVAPALSVPLAASVLPQQAPRVWVSAADSGTGLDSVAVIWQFKPAGASGWSAEFSAPAVRARGPGGATHLAALPPQPAGQRVRFRVRAVDRARRHNVATGPSAWRSFGAMPSAPLLLAADSSQAAALSVLADSLAAREGEADIWLTTTATPLGLVPLTDYVRVLIESGTHFSAEDAAAVAAAVREANGPHAFLLDLPPSADVSSAWRLASSVFAVAPGAPARVGGIRGLPLAPGSEAVCDFAGPFNAAGDVALDAVLPAPADATASVVLRSAAGAPLGVAARPRPGIATLASVASANVWAGTATANGASDPALSRLFQLLDGLMATETPHFTALRCQPPRSTPGPAPFGLRLEVPGAEGERPLVTVEVYDVRGRRTRVVWHDTLLSGLRAVVWDGRNDEGDPAAPGVYWVRAATGGQIAATRLVLLRR